jgi:hypothetical protein
LSHARIICFEHCCGTGAKIGTAGTATFCLGGTGTGTAMHFGSGSGSNIKKNTKFKKSEIRGQLSGKQGNSSASRIEKARFYNKNLLLKNCAK